MQKVHELGKGRISGNQNELWTHRVDPDPKGQQRKSAGEGKGSGAVVIRSGRRESWDRAIE